MSNIDPKNLENMIRKVLTEIIAEKGLAGDRSKIVDPSGVMSFHTPDWKPDPFKEGGEGVYLKDMVNLEESPRLGFGVMELDNTSFKWTLNYDEVDYIIDGTLEIIIDGRKVVGHAGDIIFIPAKSSIEFATPNFARFMYVVYPANWYEQ